MNQWSKNLYFFIFYIICFLLIASCKSIPSNLQKIENDDRETILYSLEADIKTFEDYNILTRKLGKKGETTFKDSLIEIKYNRYEYEGYKFVNTIAFKDSIIFVEVISDNKMRNGINTIDTTLINTLLFEKCKIYFESKYQTDFDTSTLPESIMDIMGSFGIAVGAAGTPTEHGKTYLAMKERGVNSQVITKLMTSLNPYYQLFGYLLYDEQKHQILESVIRLVEKSNYIIRYRFGCGGTRSETIFTLKKQFENDFFYENKED